MPRKGQAEEQPALFARQSGTALGGTGRRLAPHATSIPQPSPMDPDPCLYHSRAHETQPPPRLRRQQAHEDLSRGLVTTATRPLGVSPGSRATGSPDGDSSLDDDLNFTRLAMYSLLGTRSSVPCQSAPDHLKTALDEDSRQRNQRPTPTGHEEPRHGDPRRTHTPRPYARRARTPDRGRRARTRGAATGGPAPGE